MKSLLLAFSALILFGVADAQTTTPISQLPSATLPLAGSEVVPLVQSGATRKVPVSAFASYGVSVLAYNAKCDGLTVDAAAIQAAINAGGLVTFPAATCNLGSNSLFVNGNSTVLRGQAASINTTQGTILLYSGTGPAITVGTSGTLNYNNGINDLEIVAAGAATTSPGAVGLVLNNSQYFVSHSLAVVGFAAGAGLISQGNGSNGYTAQNDFYDVNFYNNYLGISSQVVNSALGENTLTIHGGWVIWGGSNATVGPVGIDLEAANGALVEGVDVESYNVCYRVALGANPGNPASGAGGSNAFIGAHSEFCPHHFQLGANATHNYVLAHRAASGSLGLAALWSDSGSDNHLTMASTSSAGATQVGKNFLYANTDGGETLAISSANGTTLIDEDTAAKQFYLLNGMGMNGCTGNFTGCAWSVTAAGAGQFASLFAPSVSGNAGQFGNLGATATANGNFVNVVDQNGHPVFGVASGGSRASDSFFGSSLNLFQDDAGTINNVSLNGQNGNGSFAGVVTAKGLVATASTVAGLPASPSQGQSGYVTDAAACTFNTAVTGGGSTKCPVVYNGAAWVAG